MSSALGTAQLATLANETALAGALRRTRAAQRDWALRTLRERCAVLRRLRSAVASHSAELVEAVQQSRPSEDAEILVSEILPLADACKFVEKMAPDLLRSKRLGRKFRPLWLAGVELEIRREPFGVVLILAPTNYPLMLPGIQAIQALAAGNAVLLKPGVGGSAAAKKLRSLAINSGVDPDLFVVLGESTEEAQAAISAGVDKILLTGSSHTGRAVLAAAADKLTPVTAELSGCDAVFVLPGADLTLVAKALRFALGLNQSQTCMIPHRILVHSSCADELLRKVLETTADLKIRLSASAANTLRHLLDEATRDGIEPVAGHLDADSVCSPLVFRDVPARSRFWRTDVFAPLLAFHTFSRISMALEAYKECPYALGVSIFGGDAEARELATKINAGVVAINDIIVPTADPRLPLSGRGESGFGITRGAEGLLELTRVKAISKRKSGYHHLDGRNENDAAMFAGYLRAAHSGDWRSRWHGMKAAMAAAKSRMKGTK